MWKKQTKQSDSHLQESGNDRKGDTDTETKETNLSIKKRKGRN